MDVQDVNKRLGQFCDYLGLSDNKISLHVGMPQPTFSRYHRGERDLTLLAIMQICKAYPELSPEWLVFGTGSMIRKHKH